MKLRRTVSQHGQSRWIYEKIAPRGAIFSQSCKLLLFKQGLDFPAVDPQEEESGHGQADDLRNGVGQPDIMDVPRQAHKVGHGQKHQHLTADGGDGGVDPVAQGLEAGAQDDAHRRHGEAVADGAQAVPADDQELLAGIEHAQQQVGSHLEHDKARYHQRQGAGNGQLQCLHDPIRPPRAIVEGDDGNGGAVQAEQGHKEEALKLEVNAEHAGGSLVEALQYLDPAEDHDGEHAVHDDGGNTHRQDGAHDPAVQPEVAVAEGDIVVIACVQVHAHDSAAPLTDDGGDGGAGGAHGGQTEPAEDEHGIQQNVDDGAGGLSDHALNGAAGGLEQTLSQNLGEGAHSENAADAGVLDAVLHGLRHVGLHLIVGTDAEEAEEHKDHGDNGHQDKAVAGGAVDGLLIMLAQALAEQGVDTDADTDAEADLHILHREGQGQGRHGALRNLSHVDAVHHVVQGLHQHGDNHGHCHVGQQLAHGHDAHFVLL